MLHVHLFFLLFAYLILVNACQHVKKKNTEPCQCIQDCEKEKNYIKTFQFYQDGASVAKSRILLENIPNTEDVDEKNVSSNKFMSFFDIYKRSNRFSEIINDVVKKKTQKKTYSRKHPGTSSSPLNFFREQSFTETSSAPFDYSIETDHKEVDESGNVVYIAKRFDNYMFFSTSEEIIEDISVNAEEISRHAINYIGIKYSKENEHTFSHNRTLVINNTGNKSYRIALITKSPTFMDTTVPRKGSNLDKGIFFEESVSGNTTDYYSGYYSSDYQNLYDADGSGDFGDIGETVNNGNKETESVENYSPPQKSGFFKKILNFINVSKTTFTTHDEFVEVSSPPNGSNTNVEKHSNIRHEYEAKEKENGSASLAIATDNTDEVTTENSFETIDQLLDQYMLNTTVPNIEVQELLISLKVGVDVKSTELKNAIDNIQKKIEEKLQKHFLPVQSMRVEITSPINFVCFFVPSVFDVHNFHILNDILKVIKMYLETYMENWSFAHMYNVSNYISKRKKKNIDAEINHTKSSAKKKRKRKYKKKKKSLYKAQMSFVNKFFSKTFVLPVGDIRNKNGKSLEDELLSFLPKEMTSYAAWNLTETRVPNAWILGGYGNENIKVCVVDTGVDLDHRDLKTNIYVPPYRKDYFMSDDVYESMVKHPIDLTGHGTHIAGIIGGASNDAGIVGVAPNVKILPLRFVKSESLGGTFLAVQAINVCLVNRCPIINASWGSHFFDYTLKTAILKLNKAFRGRGTVFITAAGNEQVDIDELPLYPSSFRINGILSVASVSDDLKISDFSNYGKNTVHLYAPGHFIYSSVPTNSYKNSTGTSMAAPHVSGVSALIYSVCFEQRFIPQAADVLNIIIRTSIKIDSSEKKTIHEGLVNAEGAVLTTLLGGLWTQTDCKYAQFTLRPQRKKHIPLFFSAYKKGLYSVYFVVTIFPTDNTDHYAEIVIPVRIFTDGDSSIFKESPHIGKSYNVDSTEELNDQFLEYICENSLFNLEESNWNKYIFLFTAITIGCFLLAVLGYWFFTKRKNCNSLKEREDAKREESLFEQMQKETLHFAHLYSTHPEIQKKSLSTAKDSEELLDNEFDVERLSSSGEKEKRNTECKDTEYIDELLHLRNLFPVEEIEKKKTEINTNDDYKEGIIHKKKSTVRKNESTIKEEHENRENETKFTGQNTLHIDNERKKSSKKSIASEFKTKDSLDTRKDTAIEVEYFEDETPRENI